MLNPSYLIQSRHGIYYFRYAMRNHDGEQLAVIERARMFGFKTVPGSIIVMSVMKESFTKNEKKLLKSLAQWGRRPDSRWRASNPVILLTGHELFADYLISATWKELGKPYEDYLDFHFTRNLYSFAFATQAIHLGLPSYYDWLSKKKKTKAARRKLQV